MRKKNYIGAHLQSRP